MIPPFDEHPFVKQFNEIKMYFRQYETETSRSRARDFRFFAKLINDAGLEVAFDFLGSVNFGQATEKSDVDLVLYVGCENGYDGECHGDKCRNKRYVEQLILTTLMQHYSTAPYQIQILDCVNFHQIDRDLETGDPDSPALLRFAFYRSICRGVYAKVLRPRHMKLVHNEDLVTKMMPNLNIIFEGLSKSSKHTWSLNKYQERIKDLGVRIPDLMINRIREHLELPELFGKEGPPPIE